MKLNKRFIGGLLALALVGAVGCGKKEPPTLKKLNVPGVGSVSVGSSSTPTPAPSSVDYWYDLEDLNDCATGLHEFTSLDGFCAGLKDNALNHNCSLYLRIEVFYEVKCPGDMTE